jgi:L-ascorbate metabolism protein UlaG (beta-lactamase superfamily)
MYIWRSAAAMLLAAGSLAAGLTLSRATRAQDIVPADVEETSMGPLTIRPLIHAAVLLQFRDKNYYIDPAGNAEWDNLPKADLVLVTHEHGDHAAPAVVNRIRKDTTRVITNERTASRFPGATVMKNGDKIDLLEVTVEAVPSYNVVKTNHPKGRDNGYVITFGDRRVYLAGDTEATPEMKALEKIDIAFLPIDGTFTMPPAEAAEGARAFKPRILYPYHQNASDPNAVKSLLADVAGIEVRVRELP